MKRIILLAIIALILASCATTGLISNTPAAVINDIVMISPESCQTFKANKEKAAFSDSLSAESSRILTDAFLGTPLDITEIIELEDSSEDYAIRKEITWLAAEKFKKSRAYVIPPQIDKLVETTGKRYCLVVFAEGYSMDDKSFAKAVITNLAFDILISVLSLGTVVPATYMSKDSSNIYMAIYDSETDQAVYYNRSLYNTDPLNPNSIRHQVTQLTKKFR